MRTTIKKPILILGAVAVLVVLVATVSITLALRAPKEPPEISVWTSSGTYTRLKPTLSCAVDNQAGTVSCSDLSPVTAPRVDVPPQTSVLLSVPAEVAKCWLLDVVWSGGDGKDRRLEHDSRLNCPQGGKDEPTYATWLRPKPSGLQLYSITVAVPSDALVPGEDNLFARWKWVVCTSAAPCETPPEE